jgi:Pyruvate/2-oxoacid:ferredoxin oxidoreductase gamma subunit
MSRPKQHQKLKAGLVKGSEIRRAPVYAHITFSRQKTLPYILAPAYD